MRKAHSKSFRYSNSICINRFIRKIVATFSRTYFRLALVRSLVGRVAAALEVRPDAAEPCGFSRLLSCGCPSRFTPQIEGPPHRHLIQHVFITIIIPTYHSFLGKYTKQWLRPHESSAHFCMLHSPVRLLSSLIFSVFALYLRDLSHS